MEIHELGAAEVGAAFRAKELSPVAVVTALATRSETLAASLGCFLERFAEDALAEARASEVRHQRGEPLGPLDGVPIAVKDNICMSGRHATAGSRILESHVAAYDAHVIGRLKAGGAIIVGRTNLDEFAMGSSNENSAYGVVRNPWDLSRVPGGSSGGSTAAVAAGLVPLALGSDTGGSVRQPAALCGVYGLRPTYGTVSRFGLIAFASSLDQIGPIARRVDDIELALQVIAGHDPRDSTSVPNASAPSTPFSIRGLRIGVPTEYFIDGLDPEVGAAVERAIGVLVDAGAKRVEVSLPHTEYGIPVYYIVANAEAASNFARFDGVRYGPRAPGDDLQAMYRHTRSRYFGPEVKRRIMLGTYALSSGYYDAYYLSGLRARTRIREDFTRAFEVADVLVTPTSPTPAFKLGERTADPLAMYLSDVYTVPSALAGLPGLAVPFGRNRAGLPLSVQVLGRPFAEPSLLALARLLEIAVGPPPVAMAEVAA